MDFKRLKIKIYGGSHTDCIGFVLEGFPKGIPVEDELIRNLLERRKPKGVWSTARKESDEPVFLSGIEEGKTNGKRIECQIKNTDVQKKGYENSSYIPRPSHVDYALTLKGEKDFSGGGRFSGRMTALLCVLGGLCLSYLQPLGVRICGYVSQIGTVEGKSYFPDAPSREEIFSARKKDICALSDEEKMEKLLQKVTAEKDSVGGKIDCCVYGFPTGKGDFLTDGIESTLSYALFGIPAVKGVEFGLGCRFASSFGSEVNDCLFYDNGILGFRTNYNGGLNGGISNGAPILTRVTLKPTPSIGKKQSTVNLQTKENVKTVVCGRHDACIIPRAVPVVESMVAVALCDLLLAEGMPCTD